MSKQSIKYRNELNHLLNDYQHHNTYQRLKSDVAKVVMQMNGHCDFSNVEWHAIKSLEAEFNLNHQNYNPYLINYEIKSLRKVIA